MHRRDYYNVVVVALLAGLIGGMISGGLFSPEDVTAKEKPRRLKILEAEGFRLVDPSGRTRAVLQTVADGSVGLVMVSKEGVVRSAFGVEANGNVVLDLKDEKSQSHATVSVTSAGNPSLTLLDKNRAGGAFLGEGTIPFSNLIVEERPAGSLILANKDGRVVWRAP